MSGASGPRPIPPSSEKNLSKATVSPPVFFDRPAQLGSSVFVIPRVPRLDDRRERFYAVDDADRAHSGC